MMQASLISKPFQIQSIVWQSALQHELHKIFIVLRKYVLFFLTLLPTNFMFLNSVMKKHNHSLFPVYDFKYLRVHFAEPMCQGLFSIESNP